MFALLLAVLLDLESPQAWLWYEQLLAEGGHGRFQSERAAFLIRETGGTLTLAPWPHSGFRHASYRGAVPARTIAILHTHPANEPRPSAQDRAEATRLGLPVIVITPRSAVAAMPGETRLLPLRSAVAAARVESAGTSDR